MLKYCLPVALLLSSAQAQAQDSLPLQPRDVFDLQAVSAPEIAPDGHAIAYVRRANDFESDRTQSHIWLISPDGSEHRPLLQNGSQTQSPVWSPDSAHLAYLFSGEDTMELRIYSVATGRHRAVTTLEGGAIGLSWSPDGRSLAYASFQPQQGPRPTILVEAPEDADWAAPAVVDDRLVFRIDGIGALPYGTQQLIVLDVDSGESKAVTRDDLGAGGDFHWSADSRSLIFSADRRDGDGTAAPDSELHRVDIETGEIETLTDRVGPDTTPRPSPDGQYLAYLGNDDARMGYHNTELYLAGSDASEPRSLTTDLDRSVSDMAWAADGSGLYIQYDDIGMTQLSFVSLEGEITEITDEIGGATFGRPYTGGSFSVSDSGWIAIPQITATRPSELAVGARSSDFEVLTDLNSDLLSQRYISDAEEIWWTSPADGRDVQGWVLYPPDFDPDQTYPMILEIHGGPFSTYAPVFTAEFQLMAAQGYVVLYTNPRGSTSYGYEFANLIHHNYPGEDYDDLMGAVDHMIDRGFIDEDRLFVTGGSGGGVLTAWIIGNTNRFAASAVVKPVINWSSFVLHADLPQFFYRYWFASAPWEDPDEYWRRSPLSLVGNVETPTLMMVGGADVRTPRSETEQYYSALRLRGVPSELVVIPDSYHSISNSRPSRLLAKVAEILRWFEAYDPAKVDEDAE